MKIVKLTEREQFESLKKGDRLLVQWNKQSTAFRKGEPITFIKIWGINSLDEVIVRRKDNLYFSIENYLNNQSCAKEVYLVKGDENESTAD